MTIIEICRVNDPKASHYVECNKQQGWDIIKFNNKYYTYLHTKLTWRSENCNFSEGHDGFYCVVNKQLYKVE